MLRDRRKVGVQSKTRWGVVGRHLFSQRRLSATRSPLEVGNPQMILRQHAAVTPEVEGATTVPLVEPEVSRCRVPTLTQSRLPLTRKISLLTLIGHPASPVCRVQLAKIHVKLHRERVEIRGVTHGSRRRFTFTE
jgi:hypothetical protein